MQCRPVEVLKTGIKEGDPDALHTFAEMERICPEPSLFDVMDALQARLSFLRQWQTFLADRPLLILPVSAEPPFPDQLDQTDFARCFEAMLPQCGLPLMGVPAASVFTGFCDMEAGRAPIGAQLVAARFREDILLAAMAEIEARGEKPGIAEP
jgi:amidase